MLNVNIIWEMSDKSMYLSDWNLKIKKKVTLDGKNWLLTEKLDLYAFILFRL